MADWQEKDLLLEDGVRLRYYRYPQPGKPPAILVHGLTDSGRVWLPVAESLQPFFDVVIFDARGHGQSGTGARGYSATEHAADLMALMQQLKLREARLVGHSMGADVATVVAATIPERISMLVLEDPPWYMGSRVLSPAERVARAAEWRADLLAMQRVTPAELHARGREQSPRWSARELDLWVAAKQAARPEVLGYLAARWERWQEQVARIRCPLLLVTGDPAEGALVRPEVAAEVARLAPCAQVVRVDGAGHSIRRDQPARYRELLLDFLLEGRGERAGRGKA